MLRLEFVRAKETADAHASAHGRQDYLLRWPDGSYDKISLTWDDELEAALAALRDRRPTMAAEAVKAFRHWLQRLLANTQWDTRTANLAGLVHIELRAAAAELYRLPWELLMPRPSDQPLAALRCVYLSYRWPGASPSLRDPSTRREGGRIVFAWSQAFGPVAHLQMIEAIEAAASAGGVAFDRATDVVEQATFARLHAELERRCKAVAAGDALPAILHIHCHGVADSGHYVLGLGDEAKPDLLDARRIEHLAEFAPWIRLVILTACDGANSGPPGSHLGSVALALHQVGFESVVASWAPLSGRAALDATRTFYEHLLTRPTNVEDALAAARSRLSIGRAGNEWASLRLFSHADPARGTRPITFRPYRGLLRFERAHARFFFGHEVRCEEAIAKLEALAVSGKPRLVVVTGASGTGKSSVVLAGVVPSFADRRDSYAVFRPGPDPERALDEALARRPATGRFLLVVDQFEEVFTHGDTVDLTAARSFTRRLWQLALAGVDVILTLRIDFVGRCGELELDDGGARLDGIVYHESHGVPVPQMPPGTLSRVIDGPAKRVGLTLETGLGERLLREIGHSPNALPLLEYALDELWARRDDDVLTHAALDALGGPVGALAVRADSVLAGMPPAARELARRLLLRMSSYGATPGSGTRRSVAEDEVRGAADPEQWTRCVGELVDARLVVRSRRGDGSIWLDVAHEALIRHWPQLWRWYEEDRSREAELTQLGEWMREWQRFPDALLSGNKLGFALRLRDTHGDQLGVLARELIERSDAAEQQKIAAEARRVADERRRHLFVLRLVIGGLFVVMGSTIALLWQRWSWSEHSLGLEQEGRRSAQAEAMRARDTLLVSVAAAALKDHDVSRSLQLLREVESEDPSAEVPGWTGLVSEALATSGVLIAARREKASVTAVAMNTDGSKVLTGLKDGSTIVWDRATDATLVLRGHSDGVTAVRFGVDDTRVFTESGGQLFEWDRDSGALLAATNTREIGATAFSRDRRRVVTASVDGQARLWDPRSGDLIAVLSGHRGRVFPVAFDPASSRLITASGQVWSAETGAPIVRLRDGWHDRPDDLASARFSPDGALVATGSIGGVIRLWDAETGEVRASFVGHRGPVSAIAFTRHMSRLVTAGHDGVAKVWAADTQKELAQIQQTFADIVMSPDESRIVTEGVRLRELLVQGHDLQLEESEHYDVSSVAFSADGLRIAAGSHRGTTTIWDASTGSKVIATQLVPAISRWRGSGTTALAFSPDGARLAAGHEDGTARLWDAHTGDFVAELSGHTEAVERIAFSPDGTHIISESADKTAREWDASECVESAVLDRHERWWFLAASPDGARIATRSPDHQIQVWNRATGARISTLRGHPGPVARGQFSADGQRFIADGGDLTLLWNTESGEKMSTYDTEHSRMEFSPSGARLLLSSNAKDPRLWDATTGAEVAPLPRSFYDFSPDGRWIASRDGHEVGLWDASNGTRKADLGGHEESVRDIFYGPTSQDGDAARMATVTGDGAIRIWRNGRVTAAMTGKSWTMALAFSGDGRRLVVGSVERAAQPAMTEVWDVDERSDPVGLDNRRLMDTPFSADGQFVTVSSDRVLGVASLARRERFTSLGVRDENLAHATFSPDGTRVVVATPRLAGIWSAETGAELVRMESDGPLERLLVSPDGNWVIAQKGFQPRPFGDIRLFRASDGVEHAFLTGHLGDPFPAASGPTGTRVLTRLGWGAGPESFPARAVVGSREVAVWDAESGALLHTLTPPPEEGMIHRATLFPGITRAMTQSTDGTIRLWDTESGREWGRFAMNAVLLGDDWSAFSARASRVAVSSERGAAVIVLDVDAGTILSTRSLPSRMMRVALSGDGSRVAAGSREGMIYVWDPALSDQPVTITTHRGPINALALSDDGARVAAVFHDGTRIFDTTTGALLGDFEGNSGVAFSPGDDWLVGTGRHDRQIRWGGRRKAIPSLLWTASPLCPSVLDVRVKHLGRDTQEGAEDHDRCEKMLRCVKRQQRRFEDCLRIYRHARARQRAREYGEGLALPANAR